MKNILIIVLLLTSIFLIPNVFAQDYMKWGLPENAILRIGKGTINDLKHSPDSDLIAVATHIGVWIYDANSGKEIRLLKHTEWVTSLDFSPNGKMLASGGFDGIHLWEPHTGQHLFELTNKKIITKLVFFPDGRTLASVANRGKIINLWDITNKTISKSITTTQGRFSSIAVSPNGKTIVSHDTSAMSKEQLIWFDVDTAQRMFSLTDLELEWVKNGKLITCLMFSPNGEILACADNEDIYLFDGVNGKFLRTLRGHEKWINRVVFSFDGKTLASAGWDKTIRLWDPHSGHSIHTFREHTDRVFALSFSPDGETLVSGSYDGTIRFWDIATKRRRKIISGHWQNMNALAFSADSKTLISNASLTILKWNTGTGQLKSIITRTGRDEHVMLKNSQSVSVIRDEVISAIDVEGDIIASYVEIASYADVSIKKENKKFPSDHTIIDIRSISNNLLKKSIDLGKINFAFDPCAALAPDRMLVIWSPENKKVAFWDTLYTLNMPVQPHFEFDPQMTSVTALAASPDGKLLAVADLLGVVSLWKFGTNDFIRRFNLIAAETLAFSNDSKTLATGSSYGREGIQLIEVDTGNHITTLPGHHNGVNALAFSANDKMLASVGDDDTILIWDLEKIIKSR